VCGVRVLCDIEFHLGERMCLCGCVHWCERARRVDAVHVAEGGGDGEAAVGHLRGECVFTYYCGTASGIQ